MIRCGAAFRPTAGHRVWVPRDRASARAVAAGRAGLGLIALVALVLTVVPARAAGAGATADALRTRLGHLTASSDRTIGGVSVATVGAVTALYRERRFRPLWQEERSVETLLTALRASHGHGFNPDDFHLAAIDTLRARQSATTDRNPLAAADLDILLTHALFALGHQLLYGKIDPQAMDPAWGFPRRPPRGNLVAEVGAALEKRDLAALIRTWEPNDPSYQRLQQALESYRTIAGGGGWPPLPEGPAIKPGMTDARVPVLRRRLAIPGDLPAAAVTADPLYDEGVVAAVTRFQVRHGLEADGIVGRRTLAALNVPVEARVDQIRANLERARWLLPLPDHPHLAINIAGFRANLVRSGEPVWSARVIVGRTVRRTPSFQSRMTTLVFNPTWTVPPTILDYDLLPKVRTDASYLALNRYQVLDGDGRVVDPETIDWQRVVARRWPYRIVQAPGPKNALGQIKFLFPNPHDIYLHDTPDRRLFDRPERTFSSGCIRIERAAELATLVLGGAAGWTAAAVERALASGQMRTILVPDPLPVLLLYWTVEIAADGTVFFFTDIYGRDAPIVKALDGAPSAALSPLT